jgi:hypothetical protein
MTGKSPLEHASPSFGAMRATTAVASALAAALALTPGAQAENVYKVTRAAAKPDGKGTPKRPRPVRLSFGYTVDDRNPALRAGVVRQYRIAAEGLVTFPGVFPSCTFRQVNRATVARACRTAKVGGGRVFNLAGASSDLTQKLTCNLRLTLYNVTRRKSKPSKRARRSRGALAIRLDGDPPAPPVPGSRAPGCMISVHTAILARYRTVRIGGLPSSELRFRVPDTLAHPLPGVDNSVRETLSRVARKPRRARLGRATRRVGFYNSIGCRGRRTTRVTFVDEQGRNTTATKTSRC